MRVISGTAKGHRLLSVPGDSTRPITDRVKTALFDTLQFSIADSRILDLFAGSGSVGIEALSRSAREAVFVEISRRALRTIGENLRRTNLASRANVVRGDAFAYLRRLELDPFDIIYVAPPQYKGMWIDALKIIDSKPTLLTEEGQVIVQIHPRESEPLGLDHLQIRDERRYGSTLLTYWQHLEPEDDGQEEVTED